MHGDLFCGLDIVFHNLSREGDFLLTVVYPPCFVFRLKKDL